MIFLAEWMHLDILKLFIWIWCMYTFYLICPPPLCNLPIIVSHTKNEIRTGDNQKYISGVPKLTMSLRSITH